MFGYAAFAQPTFAGLGNAQYAVSVFEAISYADSETAVKTFICAISESLNTADLETVIKIYNSSIAENINLSEKLLGAAWIQINDSQSSNWVIIDNRQ